MRLPNGYGSVHKLSGNRRKPYRARVTKGWTIVDGKEKQLYETVGYFKNKKEALHALDLYHATPSKLRDGISFADLYTKWSEEHFQSLSDSAITNYRNA